MARNILKSIILCFLLLAASVTAGGQAFNSLWHRTDNPSESSGLPAFRPERFLSYQISETWLKGQLASVPKTYEQAIIMDLPVPDGSFRSFRVWNTPVMEEGLAMHFPEIGTYTAEAIGAPHVTAKLDYSPAGFHALIFDGEDTYFIEPFSNTASGSYSVFYKKDLGKAGILAGVCGVTEEGDESKLSAAGKPRSNLRINGAVRRKYRLALACTGEYAMAVAGPTPTKAAVLANMTGVVNKVNGIFEREFSMTLMLVANDTAIIYLNAATDPYTNGSTSTMLGENQANLDNKIGNANYDIGHGLNVSGLGLGQLGCVCYAGKARGVSFNSGTNTYQIVSHEMGHQFNANHTFNGGAGSCSGNGVASTAFEPGSGGTIMAYPGICGTDNIQTYRDDYYHSRSLEDISTHIANTGTCPTITTSTNKNATLPSFSATYAIPFKTPFELTAPAATDATQDTLTWCWEERDLGSFGMSLAQTSVYGPLFRTIPATTSRTRVFPRLEALIGRKPLIGEKLPDVARSMVFKVTERDMYQGWGAFNFPDDTIRLNVIDTKVPFTVSYPTGGEALAAGSWPAIRWNVAGTTAAPISCAKVDIYLSVDSGMTYPYLLRSNTNNDGSETVQLPLIPTTAKARVKVKCSNNVFFNISGANFTVYLGSMGAGITGLDDQVRILPNPARDVLTIEAPSVRTGLRAQIFNMLGQSVWSGTVDRYTTVDVSAWPQGMYLVELNDGDGAQLRRKVVIR